MSDLFYDPTKLFKFNLIPPKSKEELNVLETRDNSILYSFLLVFFGMLVFFVLSLIQTFTTTPQVNKVDATLASQKAEIQAYDQVHEISVELFVKSQSLEPILQKDIKISEEYQTLRYSNSCSCWIDFNHCFFNSSKINRYFCPDGLR